MAVVDMVPRVVFPAGLDLRTDGAGDVDHGMEGSRSGHRRRKSAIPDQTVAARIVHRREAGAGGVW